MGSRSTSLTRRTSIRTKMNLKFGLLLACVVIACTAQQQQKDARQQIRERIAALERGGRTRVNNVVQEAQELIDTSSIQLNVQEYVNAMTQQAKARVDALNLKQRANEVKKQAKVKAQLAKAQVEQALQQIKDKNVVKELKQLMMNLEKEVRGIVQPHDFEQ